MPKQLFKRSHRPRRVFAGTAHGNPVTDPAVLGSLMPQVFFKNLAQLLPSREPVKGELFVIYYFMELPSPYMSGFHTVGGGGVGISP